MGLWAGKEGPGGKTLRRWRGQAWGREMSGRRLRALAWVLGQARAEEQAWGRSWSWFGPGWPLVQNTRVRGHPGICWLLGMEFKMKGWGWRQVCAPEMRPWGWRLVAGALHGGLGHPGKGLGSLPGTQLPTPVPESMNQVCNAHLRLWSPRRALGCSGLWAMAVNKSERPPCGAGGGKAGESMDQGDAAGVHGGGQGLSETVALE